MSKGRKSLRSLSKTELINIIKDFRIEILELKRALKDIRNLASTILWKNYGEIDIRKLDEDE